MSFKKAAVYPCNPATTRGEATRLSVHKDKLVYANGRTVIVRVSPRIAMIGTDYVLRSAT